ncbi:MAG: indole-3-glycerol phosphate synthase TrpC [Chloroflexota bacterium]
MTNLGEIVAYTRTLVKRRKVELPLSFLQDEIERKPHALDLAAALSGNPVALIAEVKKASPSRGLIRSDFDHVAIAEAYAMAGASAISVLTEPRFFLGSLDHLAEVAALQIAHRVPLLRKDFIIDPYQVYEARAHGADAVLLIAAILDRERLDSLLSLSHDLGMTCLVEVHNEREIDVALLSEARVIGINNRDLHSFKVDLSTFERLRPRVPAEKLVVAESGINCPADIRRLAHAGADAVLVGEALMTADDISAMTREFACAA